MIGLSFDVEERFHSHLTDGKQERTWKAGDRVSRLIDLLLEHGGTATFFVVGDMAEHYPALIRRIADSGFEVASHSHRHIKMDASRRTECMADVTRSKQVLEDISGSAVVGFRSPTWSASLSDDWLWDHLQSLGFLYDSSLFPFPTHMYGSYANPVRPFRLRPELIEIPPSVWGRGPIRVPYGGGFFFRMYPTGLTHWLMDSDRRIDRTPIVYMHPWEFDVQDDQVESSWLNRFIGNVNVPECWDRLRGLLTRYPTRTLRSLRESLPVAALPMRDAGAVTSPR